MKLLGKAAIVTGASRGIGKGLALAIAKEGADVVVNSLDTVEADEVVDQIRSMGRESFALRGDVSCASDVEALIAATVKKFGRIDILVNNAGISVFKPFFEVTEQVWDRTLPNRRTT
ncbi:MAG: SDR family NAD(P)-dependent oxidoreductase [Armatimonadetes bacterium]|nr:SDR family NAD(P)-dependent oxidoreductase [Armatimonadota bacterium]